MLRRRFITLLGGAAAASSLLWPPAARAQRPLPVVGYLGTGLPEAEAYRVASFRQGLSELGLVEGRNVTIEYRWAQKDIAWLPELAGDLVRRNVAAIATPFSTPAAL